MTFETCPLFDEISWIKHGFYDAASSSGQKYLDEFPKVLRLNQTHSDKICFDQTEYADEADASVTFNSHVGLAIKTADCCPVLLVCTHSQQIAAVHSGWPGAVNRITAKTVDAMIGRGAKPENIIAAIGPCIHQDTFPVQDDVRDKIAADQPEMLVHFTRFEDRWKMDVAGIVRQQLKDKCVTQIWQSPINTFMHSNYASYRADKTKDRNISIIMKK